MAFCYQAPDLFGNVECQKTGIIVFYTGDNLFDGCTLVIKDDTGWKLIIAIDFSEIEP